MRYLLDTNILSDLLRDPQGAVFHRIGEVGDDVVTSVIVAAELRFGEAKNPRRRLKVAIEGLLSRIDVLPFEPPADSTYARLRADLERNGRPLANNDLLIAAHALTLGCTLVTADTAFRHVPGLAIENWLTP